jgi:hypothetical protein
VEQKMYFRDCKTLSVFERKIPLTKKNIWTKKSPKINDIISFSSRNHVTVN